MTGGRIEIGAEDLHAYLDGELGSDRDEEVARAVELDEALAEKIALFREDKQRIAAAYGSVANRPLPAEWLAQIDAYPDTRKHALFFTRPLMALAATVLLMVAIGVGYLRWNAPQQDTIIAEAFAARSQSLQPNTVLAVNSAHDAGKVDGVIATALKMHVKAPDLAKLGYSLTGLRIYNGVLGGEAVELLYRDARNRDVALYVRHSSGAVRFDQFKESGMRVCIWQDDVIGTVITGKMSAAEMQRLASLAYSGLET